ncbi:hypothetical protein FK268_17510 [Tsukamurella sputi]|uniref:Uncharacterized protein n=1 Tax=Tsukamurella sputi TaxID=2591848 RepID=A0A5C5RL37_9ACTN|nr:hypothetical protein [Tsukamurella sputi]TWS22805.1 hypothetical protein FK268_17510 [Tsukamurella sputi]
MSNTERSAYVTVPTGWPDELVLEYAEHVLRDRGSVAGGDAVSMRVTDSCANADHTTTWRVRYSMSATRAVRAEFRPLSLR